MIGGDQEFSGMERGGFHTCGREFEDDLQRDYILRNGVIVPVEGRMRSSLLEEDGFGFNQFVAAYTAVRHVRVAVGARIEMVGLNHCFPSLPLMNVIDMEYFCGMERTFRVSAGSLIKD